MPITGHQKIALMGQRFFFQEDAASGSPPNPLVDLGNVIDATPDNTVEKLTATDISGGVEVDILEVVRKTQEKYALQLNNVNPYNLGIFYGGYPKAFTQTASAKTQIKHWAYSGQRVQILDAHYNAGGAAIFQIDSAQTFNVFLEASPGGGTAAASPLAASAYTVDYDRGQVIITDAALDAGALVFITFTPKAITGKRLIVPQTAPVSRTGTVYLWLGEDNNASMSVRHGKATVSGTGFNPSVTQFSQINMDVTMLSDLTQVANPAGFLKLVKGSIPTFVGPIVA